MGVVLLAVLVVGVSAVPRPAVGAGAEVDPYGTDANHDEGYRDAVCNWNRAGRIYLMGFIRHMFPLVQDVQGYACREIADPDRNGCNGQWEPVFSICWSTHASGRAIDVFVGGGLNEPTEMGINVGDEVVTWLLQNHKGADNYFVRVMGIQQILWNGRCWGAYNEGDRKVTHADGLRRCGIGNHDNHVHLTLSNAGADGRTSWYANPEPRSATLDLDLDELIPELAPDDPAGDRDVHDHGEDVEDPEYLDAAVPPDPISAAATNA